MTEFDDLERQVRSCTLCPLAEERTNAVPGEGARDADVMFIGEGPGFHEDRQGRPFVGPAGKFLDELLHGIGLRREDVYITNMVKCRPPKNRDPLPAELAACRPYMDSQLDLIKPKVIATLGRFSFSKFFPNEPISRARGKARKWASYTVFPMYHPAAALHNPGLRPTIEGDFSKLPALINEIAEAESAKPEPQQLGLFGNQ